MGTTEIKHRNFAKNLVKHGGNQVKAYMETYPNCSNKASAQVLANRILHNDPKVAETIYSILERNDMGVGNITKRLSNLLDATKDIVTGKGDIVVCRDNSTRMDAIKTAYRLHGHLSTSNTTNIDSRSVTVHQYSPEDIARLEQVATNMAALSNTMLAANGNQSGELDEVESIRPQSTAGQGDPDGDT